MCRIPVVVIASTVVTVGGAGPAFAQDARREASAMLVPGVVYQHATFGDDSPRSTSGPGLTIGLQVRGPQSGRTALVVEAMVQPNALENPHLPERFLSVYVLGGVQIGRRTYVRPGGGVAFQGGGIGPVLGVAVGRSRQSTTGFLAGAEFVIRASGTRGLAGVIAGVHLLVR
jgi:hypothetical protein